MENKVRYSTYNNLELCGILNKVNDTKEIVIICHARTSSKDSNATTSLANELTKNNINNFRFDFISCGESDGDYTEYTVSNMIKNLEDTIKYLQSEFNSFILVGCSMGGRIVSLIDNPSIKKLVLWYPALDYKRGLLNLPSKNEKIAKKQGFCVMEKGVKFSYEYFKDERSYIPYKVLYKKDIPVLFVHGTKDPYVPYISSVKVSKKCKNAKLILINGGDHGFHEENNMKEALEETISFIKNN